MRELPQGRLNPKVKSVSAETFAKLGSPISEYTYVNMWAGPPVKDGVCDVEEGVTGMIRTEGPVITLNGAWAQNIGPYEMFIDFLGTKGGARLQYRKEFTLYSTKNGMLTETVFNNATYPPFQKEIDEFVRSIEEGEKLVSHIDTHIITAQMMDAIYRSAEEHREIVL